MADTARRTGDCDSRCWRGDTGIRRRWRQGRWLYKHFGVDVDRHAGCRVVLGTLLGNCRQCQFGDRLFYSWCGVPPPHVHSRPMHFLRHHFRWWHRQLVSIVQRPNLRTRANIITCLLSTIKVAVWLSGSVIGQWAHQQSYSLCSAGIVLR